MARKNTIRLLLINASDNDSELLISQFRNAGRVARAHRVADAADFVACLQQEWDLLIADDNHPEIKLESCLEHLQEAKSDLPIIVLRNTTDVKALFARGVRDVIAPTDEQRLVCAALREIDHIDLQRNIKTLQQRIDEAEQRNALLLDEADQPIAYVTDGMVIGANALFAERFGYDDESEIDCVPIVDLLSAVDQDGFKSALKNGVEAEFACSGQRADGETFSANVRLLNSTYDGDACTQLIIADPSTATAGGGNSNCDSDTQLFTRQFLIEQITKRSKGWLLFIAIDKFTELRREIGFNASIELIKNVAQFIADNDSFTPTALARVADNGFAMLLDAGEGDDIIEQARQLSAAASKHNFSPSITLSIGISAVGQDEAATVLDKAFEAEEKARTNSNGDRVHLQRIATRAQVAKNTVNDAEHLLDEALEVQRFALLFQPIISLRGATGEHYEVLLRMRGATDTLELPDNFIESLGTSAANAKLDRWVILEATKQLAVNRGKGNDTRLVINLTANVLLDESLATWLGVALKAAGLPPATVILQLSEADIANDMQAAKKFANAIHQLGCKISLSGFGRVPESHKELVTAVRADMAQIDGNFTRMLHTNNDSQSLKTLIAETGSTGVKTIVPFVENASVLATLWQVGADFIQGHYLQAPSREMNYEFTDIA